MSRRTSLAWLGALLLGACAKDYDRFRFEGEDTTASGMGGQASTTSGMGGGQPIEVACGGDACDPSSNLHCCLDQAGAASGTCKNGCAAAEADLACDGPADCPGEICCLLLDGTNYDRARCQVDCAAGALELCDPEAADPCDGGACEPLTNLPEGFNACD